MGKSSTKQKNSVSKAKSTSCQKRTYRKLPQGYKATKNAKVVDGVVEIHNGKPLFTTDRYGRKRIATDRNGNPAHKKAQLVVDPQAYAEAKKRELQQVTIKTHADKKGGHPHIIIDDIGDKHVSVGLTSDAYKGKGHRNIKLQRNPLGGNKPSYMKRQGTVDRTSAYSDTRSGRMVKHDHEKAKQIGEKTKKKYLKNKK